MLRPNDEKELSRNVLARAIAEARGKALEDMKRSLRVDSRTSAERAGWVAAFREYPFQIEASTSDEVKVSFFDIECGVSSDSGTILGDSPTQVKDSIGFIIRSSFSIRNILYTIAPKEEVLEVIEGLGHVSSQALPDLTNFGFEDRNLLSRLIDRSDLLMFNTALMYLLNANLTSVLRSMLGPMVTQTPKEIIAAYRMASRIQSMAPKSSYIPQWKKDVVGSLTLTEDDLSQPLEVILDRNENQN